MSAVLGGMSDEHWRVRCALSHLRNDTQDLAMLAKHYGPFTPERLEHMKESVALLTRIIDGHGQQPTNVLPELQVGVLGNQDEPELAMDVSSA
jgi:hypothetical protein